jgi:hypothetical protein
VSGERRIFKYDLAVTGTQMIMMPRHAKVLSVQDQNGRLCVWAKVDPHAPADVRRRFVIVGTGHNLPIEMDSLTYLASVQQGAFVWHVFLSEEE